MQQQEPDEGLIDVPGQWWLFQTTAPWFPEHRPPEQNLSKDALFEWESHCAN